MSGMIVSLPPAAAAADPVVAAAGDIACDPGDSAFHGGDGTSTRCHEKYTGNQLSSGGYAGVLALGDEQYECGSASAFSQSYGPTWGVPAVKAVTHPAPGNHEYDTSGGSGCGSGASGYFGYYGSAAGDPAKGYYSFDIGAWHLISLNSNCTFASCSAGSAQENWLAQDLAAHPNTCTVAYWHHPAFSAGPSTNGTVRPFWNDLYAAHADLVLNGHKHNYERLTKLTPSGSPDATNGIREIIVGTGGRDHGLSASLYPGTEASDGKHFGILELTLHAGSYGWRFVADTGAVLDTGSATCNTGGTGANTPPTANAVPAQTTSQDTALPIQLAATDPETCELTFTIVTQPSHASALSPSTVPCTAGNPNSDSSQVNYAPAPGYSGPDSFRWKVTDEAGADSNIVTVGITVNPAAGVPTADPRTSSTAMNTPTSVQLSGHDAQSCELTFSVVDPPSAGLLGSITDQDCAPGNPNTDTASIVYTPNDSFVGQDSFTYTVTNAALVTSTKAIVTLNVGQQGISLRSASGAVNSTATTLELPVPAGVQAGDVMIAQVDVRGGPAITAPAGWSTIRVDTNPTQMKAGAYYRLATASEPSSYTWTFSKSEAASGGIAAYAGVDTSAPIETSSSAQATTGTFSITAPSVTTAVGGEMIVGLFTSTGVGTVTPPAGTVERWDVNSTAGQYKIISEMADVLQAAAGATGDKVATATISGRNIGQLIALKPAN